MTPPIRDGRLPRQSDWRPCGQEVQVFGEEAEAVFEDTLAGTFYTSDNESWAEIEALEVWLAARKI
ncbi:MAG: hypothetical protein ACRD1F_09530 [Terriglobales bacterium]